MKNLKTLSLVIFVLMGALAFGQTSLTQTTISAQITQGTSGAASGITGSYITQLALASATGVNQAFNGQPITFVYVDQELFGILSLAPGQTTIWNALRAQAGTKASAHASGTMALVETVSQQFGGFSGSGGFQQTDPPLNGNCTAANTLATPWVNVLTGAQWLCSSITNTWVPGWNNSLYPGAARVTAAQASVAGACTISGPLFHTTGTNACTSFTIPVGFNATAVGGGQFCTIPDGAFTTTATNNIAKATTAVVNQTLCFTWDATNSKFTASY